MGDRRIWGVTAITVLAYSGLAIVPPLPESPYPYTARNYAASADIRQSQGDVTIAALSFTMKPGASRNLRAEVYVDGVDATSDSVGTMIACADGSGKVVTHAWSGTNVILGNDDVQIVTQFMFIVPYTQPRTEDYVCRLSINTVDHAVHANGEIDVRSVSFIGDMYGVVGTNTPTTTEVAENFLATPATYVVPGQVGTEYDKIRYYRIPSWATKFDAVGVIYASDCYNPGVDCSGQAGSNRLPTVAVTRLEAIEYRGDGHTICARHYDDVVRTRLSRATHHHNIIHRLSGLTHTPGCGNLWKIAVLLTADPQFNGYTITWHGGPYTVTYTRPY